MSAARRGHASAPCFVALVALAGCAATSTRISPFDARASAPEALRARELAPDLFARATQARDEAARAADPEVARDHEQRADLLLETAIVEAERVEIDRRRAGLELRIEHALAARAEQERARRETEAALERADAASIARREAERAFAQAELDETRRFPSTERERAQTADVLQQRATLVLAAASALGLADAERERAQAALDAAAPVRGGGAGRLARARDALEAAERALGEARTAAPGPSPEETASLVAACRERGLACELLERGFAVGLAAAFAPGSKAPSVGGRRQLEHVAALARAHPHGPLAIEVFAESATPAARRLAAERARRVAAALAGAGARVRIEASAHAIVSDAPVQVVFGAYARLPTDAALQ